MLYRVVVDGIDILDYSDQSMVLLSPQAEIEIDASGSFEFTLPPNHTYYDMFTAESIMNMTVEIYEDTILHWFGRPIELHLDFYKNKKVYCEGALGFFNDSIIREEEYENTLLSLIFTAVIAEHNSMVNANRQFTVGNFTVSDHAVYRKFNYEQTSDVLKSKFLDAEEGHFFLRRENGINYIDFLKDMPYSCNQQVEFSKNLLNFTYSFDGKDFATCVIPLGANNSETNKPVDIKSVNNNSDILIGSAAEKYGNIVKVQQYSDIEDPYTLKEEGEKYLRVLQWNAFLIECSATDLNATDDTKQQFRVGQTVTCISNPHGINLELPISKMTLYLDSAAKQITLGRIPKKTLSRFYKEKVSGGEPSYEPDDIFPEGYSIIDDPGTGEPTLIKVPVMMQIMTLPYRDGSQANSTYAYGDALNFNGLTAKLVAKGQSRYGNEEIIYFSDSNYINGDIPFNELGFDPVTYNQHVGKLMVWCTWLNPNNYYNGIKFRKAFYMQSLSEAAAAAANSPENITSIKIVSTGLTYAKHKVGQFINYSGFVVKAYRSDGSEFTGNGYSNGRIPNSELTFSPKKVPAYEDRMAYNTRQGESFAHMDQWSLDNNDAERVWYDRTFTLVNDVPGYAGIHKSPITMDGQKPQYQWNTFFFITDRPGAILHCVDTAWSGGTITVGPSERVYNNETIYVYDSWGLQDSSVNPNFTSGGVRIHSAKAVLEGTLESIIPNIACGLGEFRVTVSWKRPGDGVVLTDSTTLKYADSEYSLPGNGGR